MVKKLTNDIIKPTVLKGKYEGEDVLIPRVPIFPTDMLFNFKRLKFPVRLAFAMSINKLQGKSLGVRGIYPENLCFSRQTTQQKILYSTEMHYNKDKMVTFKLLIKYFHSYCNLCFDEIYYLINKTFWFSFLNSLFFSNFLFLIQLNIQDYD